MFPDKLKGVLKFTNRPFKIILSTRFSAHIRVIQIQANELLINCALHKSPIQYMLNKYYTCKTVTVLFRNDPLVFSLKWMDF